MQACRTVPSVLLVHSASCKNHELCCDQACTQRTSIDVHFQRRISRSHSSAGQSVRLITVRSAAQARVGPSVVTQLQKKTRATPKCAGAFLACEVAVASVAAPLRWEGGVPLAMRRWLQKRTRDQKGLRDRNSPTCTLSQNGYGDDFHSALILLRPEGARPEGV